MKHITLSLLLIFLLSCGEEKSTTQAPLEEKPAAEAPVEAPKAEAPIETEADSDPLGLYVGAFEASKYNPEKKPSYSNRITISINRMEEGKVFGHSVVAGNIRPFEGKVETDAEGNLVVEAKEPGDDRYDGTFQFSILKNNASVEGKWIANDKNLSVTERSYTLRKTLFDYDPDLELPGEVSYDGLYDTWEGDEAEILTSAVTEFNASKTLLKKEDVENMYKADLEFVRNAIYARHGYSFKNRRVRYVFDSVVDWYVPVSTDIRDQLTDIEIQNIDLLKRYEEHASEYYDSFGR
ncbi:MAG: YARHG domain-containing protein [Bacteroidota bacterium]